MVLQYIRSLKKSYLEILKTDHKRSCWICRNFKTGKFQAFLGEWMGVEVRRMSRTYCIPYHSHSPWLFEVIDD